MTQSQSMSATVRYSLGKARRCAGTGAEMLNLRAYDVPMPSLQRKQ